MEESDTQSSGAERRLRTRMVLLAFLLFSIFVIGLAYMATTPRRGLSS